MNGSAQRFGEYELLASIGEGGMGEIFAARSAKNDEVLALKIMLPSASQRDSLVAMFMDEAAIMAQIHHPHVLGVYDFGKQDGRYFFAMEYLEGQSLARLIVEAHKHAGEIPHGVAAMIGAHAARGLEAAHTAKSKDGTPLEVVHRDVSPQNVFVTYAGATKMIDFGIARATQRLTRTSKGVFKGKAAYMAPEQIENKNVDARSDVFALGICLWETIAGCRLFVRENQFHTMNAVMNLEVEPPTETVGKGDYKLDAIVMRALERDPDKRWSTAGEMERALRAYAAGLRPPASRASVAQLMKTLFEDEIREVVALRANFDTPSPSAALLAPVATDSGDGALDLGSDDRFITFAGRVEDIEEMDRLIKGSEAVHVAIEALSSELASLTARQQQEVSRLASPVAHGETASAAVDPAPAAPTASRAPLVVIGVVIALLLAVLLAVAAMGGGDATTVQPLPAPSTE